MTLNLHVLTLPSCTFAARLNEKLDLNEPLSQGDNDEVIQLPQKEDKDSGKNKDNTQVIMFTKPDESATYHIKPLYIKAHIDGIPVNRVLVDNWCVPSSMHQMLMFWNGAEVEVVKADNRPFKVESHAVDMRFYDGSTGPIYFPKLLVIPKAELITRACPALALGERKSLDFYKLTLAPEAQQN